MLFSEGVFLRETLQRWDFNWLSTVDGLAASPGFIYGERLHGCKFTVKMIIWIVKFKFESNITILILI